MTSLSWLNCDDDYFCKQLYLILLFN